MARGSALAPGVRLSLPADSPWPLYRQLYSAVREAILAGQLAAGTRLPSTRVLARQLGLARMTVVNAFEQLLAEGYVEGRVGAGTFVARALPDALLQAAPLPSPRSATGVERSRRLSRRGAMLARITVSSGGGQGGSPRAFRPGVPALDALPLATWAALAARRYRRPPAELLSYASPAGYRPLREAIAGHLLLARAVRCTAEQVIVVAGSQQALDLTARLVLDPGDSVWMEDPGYGGARAAFLAAGGRLVPARVDGEGLVVEAAEAACAAARLAYVTPSHQYPLGVTMSLPRRLALLEWARRADAWVLEDDYDSEFRYAGRPLAALQGLDQDGRVIYSGTFSKVLFPALRLGYLVVPPDLVQAFGAARAASDRQSPSLDQAVLADFIGEGHFARHIRRMRALYAERQAALVAAARADLRGLLEVEPAEAGMHLVGWLPGGVDAESAARAAMAAGIEAPPLSAYRLRRFLPEGAIAAEADSREGGAGAGEREGLVLGYAAVDAAAIRQGVRQLRDALGSLLSDIGSG